jgi:CRP/FNR family transcriptional regulator, nitrogen fixation regulation protein
MLTYPTALGNSVRPSERHYRPLDAVHTTDSEDGAGSLDRLMHFSGIVVSYARNAEIFGEDEAAESLYKVISGTACTYKILSDGRRQIGEFYLPGECFGLEYTSKHSYSAEAITDAEILVVKKSAVMALAGRDPAVTRRLLTLTAIELARVQDRILLLSKTAQERVVGFLLEMARRMPTDNAIDLPMLRQDIADYLGLTIETVSRTLKTLKNHAAIDVSTRHVVLRNRLTLSRMNG